MKSKILSLMVLTLCAQNVAATKPTNFVYRASVNHTTALGIAALGFFGLGKLCGHFERKSLQQDLNAAKAKEAADAVEKIAQSSKQNRTALLDTALRDAKKKDINADAQVNVRSTKTKMWSGLTVLSAAAGLITGFLAIAGFCER